MVLYKMVSHATGLKTKDRKAIRMSLNGKPFSVTPSGYRNYKAKAATKYGTKVTANTRIPGRAMSKAILGRKIAKGKRASSRMYPMMMMM